MYRDFLRQPSWGCSSSIQAFSRSILLLSILLNVNPRFQKGPKKNIELNLQGDNVTMCQQRKKVMPYAIEVPSSQFLVYGFGPNERRWSPEFSQGFMHNFLMGPGCYFYGSVFNYRLFDSYQKNEVFGDDLKFIDIILTAYQK